MSLPQMYSGKSELRHPITHAPWISANPTLLQLGGYHLFLWRSHPFIPSPHKPLWAPCVCQADKGTVVSQWNRQPQDYRGRASGHSGEPRKGNDILGDPWRWMKGEERVGLGATRRLWLLQVKGITCRGNSYYNQACDWDISALHAHGPLG